MSLHKLQSASRCMIVGVLITLIIASSTPASAKETVLYTFTVSAMETASSRH